MESVDSSKLIFREKFTVTVGGIVLGCLFMCMNFFLFLHPRNLYVQFICVQSQRAISNQSGASVFLFFSHAFWVGSTDVFLA